MARQALIKLRRGSGAPADGVLAEGELAIDIAGKKLYSANATGNSFTLSGDQYNLAQSGNATHGIITLNVDNTTLSNDNVYITGGADVVVAGNTSVINVNVTSTLDSVLTRGNTSLSTIGVGNTTIAGFANISGNVYVGNSTVFWTSNNTTINVGTSAITNTTFNAGANVIINTTAYFVGNSTVNTSISSTIIDTDAALTVSNTAGLGNTTVTGFINVSSTANVGGVLNARANVVVNGQVIVANGTSSTSTTTGALTVAGGVGITENLYVGGNLFVQGVTTQVSSTTVTIDDSLIKLAANQTGTDEDLVDAGWYMTYDVSNTQRYSGMIRDTSNANKAFVFFNGITTEPAGTVTYTSNDLAYIEAIIDGGTY